MRYKSSRTAVQIVSMIVMVFMFAYRDAISAEAFLFAGVFLIIYGLRSFYLLLHDLKTQIDE